MPAAYNYRLSHIYWRKLRIARAVVLLLCSAAGVPSVFGQNLISNGDFETPPFAPSFTVSGWNVGGSGFVHSIAEGATSPIHSASLNIGGDSQGNTLSQSFPTTIGTLYRLDFDSAIYGIPDGSDLLKLNVKINGAASLIDDSVIPFTANTFDTSMVRFRHYQYIFRADSTMTTLEFSDSGLGNSISDTIVDTVSVSATPTPPPANLINNGSFETGPFNTVGTVTGWSVGGNVNIGATCEGATAGSHSASFSAGGDSDGNTLSQAIPTVPGKQYTLDFDAGVFGPDPGTPLQLNVTVTGSAVILNDTVTPPVASTLDGNAVEFNHYHYTFVADSPLTMLVFTDIGAGNPNTDTVLDNVYVPQVNLLTNGDFETPPFNTYSITGWTESGGGKVEANGEGATSPSHGAAFGTGGNPPGNQLSQTVPTIAGRIYALDFDAGVYGVHSGSALQLSVGVIGNGIILDKVVTPPEAGTYTPAQLTFQHYHYTFIANSAMTALQFQDLGNGGIGADLVLDTVVVNDMSVYSFSQWQSLDFTTGQRGNPSVSAWDADPDTDLLANGLEFFFNSNPLIGIPTADTPNLPRIGINTNGSSRYLTLTYHRLIGWTGNPEVIQVSDDMITRDNSQTQIEQVGTPTLAGDGMTEIVTVRLKTPINQGPVPRKFLRIGLTQ